MTGDEFHGDADEAVHLDVSATLEVDGGATPKPGSFDLISDRRRRLVLEKLVRTSDAAVSLEDLVDHVLTREPARSGDTRSDHRREVVVSLHHAHLPRLVDAGVMEYDPRSRTVRYDGDERLERTLEAVGYMECQ